MAWVSINIGKIIFIFIIFKMVFENQLQYGYQQQQQQLQQQQ